MRIGVITTSYPRFAGDARGSFVAAHVAAMRARGHTVDVIAAGASSDDGVVRIPSPLFEGAGAPDELERGGSRIAAVAFTARLTAAVARRSAQWDLIVAHWLAPSAIAALPSRVPLLAIGHGGDIHTLRRMHLLAPMLHALRVRRARLAFVSADLLAIARAAAPSRWLESAAIVQPMGVDLAHFAAVVRAPADPPTILVVARLVPIKGVDVALAAFERLRTPARLVIAGDGPLRSESHPTDIIKRTRRTFLGAVDASHRDRLLREAAVVVVPSRVLANGRTEGTPMIAIEALAAGVPLVASAVGGLRDLAAATLVPPDDPDALARAIDRTIAAPHSTADLRQSVAHLDWAHVVMRLLAHAV